MTKINIWLPLFIFLFGLTGSTLLGQRTVGLFSNTPQSFNGYTLLSPSTSKSTFLIDNCGRLINEWESNFFPGLIGYLRPNGDLMRTIRIQGGNFPSGGAGGGVELMDWDGNRKWIYQYSNEDHRQHHDIAPLPDGNVLILAWELISADSAQNLGIVNPYVLGLWPEHIIEVQPVFPDSGIIVWEWHLMDHIIQDMMPEAPNFGVVKEHPELIDVHFFDLYESDFIHANSIDYNPDLDQIMISSRNANELWVIDHSTTTEEAAGHSGGNSGRGGDILYRWGNPQTYDRGTLDDQVFFGQHDAHWIPKGMPHEGDIMVFNNGSGAPENRSKVQILSPPVNKAGQYNLRIDSTFEPLMPHLTISEIPTITTFFSPRVSGAQMQPNGNILICDGVEGDLYELTPADSLAWSYKNPIANTGPLNYDDIFGVRDVFRAYRYSPEYSAFEGRELSPGNVLELNAPLSNCEIFMTTGIHPNALLLQNVQLQVLSSSKIEVTQLGYAHLRLEMFDLTGRSLDVFQMTEPSQQFNLAQSPSGIYLFRIANDTGQYQTWKVFLP